MCSAARLPAVGVIVAIYVYIFPLFPASSFSLSLQLLAFSFFLAVSSPGSCGSRVVQEGHAAQVAWRIA